MNQLLQNQQKSFTGMLQEWQIPYGLIKPLHLAATTTVAKGDLYYVDVNGLFKRLPIGTTGQVLTVVAGVPTWV